jgi:glucose-6-phosphate 1-dehydrogenase
MQVMTMLAMDRPDSLDGDELRDEKVSTAQPPHTQGFRDETD